MWLGRCWVCHVGDTATNMTLALWMWNNTWQAELLISNHLLSWYAPGNCCTTVFLQHCLYTLVHHHVKCYRLEKKHCCLWCICPRTVQLSQILHFCAFFQSARCWSTFQTIPPQHTSTICPERGRCAPFLPRGSLFRDVSTFRGHVVRQGMGGCWCDIKSSCF